jgi:uncharacterized protein (TIGR03437 family)
MKKILSIILPLLVLSVANGQTPVLVNSASYKNSGVVTNHQICSMFGNNLAPSTEVATSLPLPEELSGVSIIVTSIGDNLVTLAPLLFVSPTQINFVIPEPVSGTISLVIERNGVVTHSFDVRTASVNPGIFTESTQDRVLAPVGNIFSVMNGISTSHTIVNRMTGRLDTLPKFQNGSLYILSIYGTGIKDTGVFPFKTLVAKNTRSGVEYRLEVAYTGSSFAFLGLDLVNVHLSNSGGYLFPQGVYECVVEYSTLSVGQTYRSNMFYLRLD